MYESGNITVHRASLLRELLTPLPKEVLHADKKLASIQEYDNGKIETTFQDGVIDHFDAIIGADGVYSSVRSYVLEEITDRYKAQPIGFWDCRVLVPIKNATAY